MWSERKNALVAIFGDPGTGKSYTAISLAERVDDKFNIDKVVFTAQEFLEVIDKCDRGEVIIFDEAGVGVPAREWQSVQNKLISYVLQTFRYKNLCVIFTTPHVSYIDKQVRLLINIAAVTKKVHISKDIVQANFYFRDSNPLQDIPVFKPLKIINSQGEYDINPVYVPKPREELVKLYEEKSRKYKEKVREEAREKIKQLEEGIAEKYDGRRIKKLENQSNALKLLVSALMDEGYSIIDLSKRMGITPQTFHAWKNEWGL